MSKSKISAVFLAMDELPEKPEGWTKRMYCHINYGSDGGSAVYDIFTPEGEQAPFFSGYDTRIKGERNQGFFYANGPYMSWAELRADWPAFIAEARQEAS